MSITDENFQCIITEVDGEIELKLISIINRETSKETILDIYIYM